MADALLIKTLVVILASVSAISLVARAKLPAAAGYLLAGLVIGPHGLNLIATSDETRFLAELGIIFLMFMVGLEFSISAMIAARRDVFGAGSLQVGFTVLIMAGVAMLWGAGLPTAMLLGGAVAMSSTAITLKQLVDQGDVSSRQGRLVLGILLFQDLAVLPFLDVLLALFFVTTGMEVDPSTVTAAPMAVLAWMIACLPGKALVVMLVGAIMRWPAPVGARAALILAHGGEDGLLLLTQAMRVGAIEPNVGQPALLAAAATMALGPVLFQQSARIAELVSGASHRTKADAEEAAIREESD